MKRRVKRTKFECFSLKFLIISSIVFVFGITYAKSLESSYNKTLQRTESEIKQTENVIDYLESKKQKMASFSRLNNIASEKGYMYNNESVASSTTEQPQ